MFYWAGLECASSDRLVNTKALKLHGVHGIRWVASIRNVLVKIFRMPPLILAALDMWANELFGTQAFSMLTSNEMLINVIFKGVSE